MTTVVVTGGSPPSPPWTSGAVVVDRRDLGRTPPRCGQGRRSTPRSTRSPTTPSTAASRCTRPRRRRCSSWRAGNNVILSTPTGSGKSLVGEAAHLHRAGPRRAQRVHRADQGAGVGEVLQPVRGVRRRPGRDGHRRRERQPGRADHLLHRRDPRQLGLARGGRVLRVGVVVADEFHFYADPQRGWAWQVPVLELGRAQFLLMSATLGPTRFFEDELTRTDGPRHRARHVGRTSGAAHVRVPHHHVAQLGAGAARHRQGADLHRALHPARRHRGGAGLPQPRPAHQGREAAGQGADRRVSVRFPVRPGPPAVPDGRGRRAPRRAAPQVPAARRAARPGGAAEDHLRHRHPRCRRQRADPIGAVHPAVQVRRQRSPDPQRPRVPADRRARRAARVRRRRRRVGAGAAARRRQRAGGGRRQRSTRRSARSWSRRSRRSATTRTGPRTPSTGSSAAARNRSVRASR